MKALAQKPEDEISHLTEKAQALLASAAEYAVVTDAESEERAATFLGHVKGMWKKIDETRKFFVKPIKDHAKTIDAGFAKSLEPLEEAETIVKEGIKKHRTSEEFLAAEAHRKSLEEAGRNAAIAGDVGALETLSAEHREVSAIAPKTVTTGSGKMTMRRGAWKIEVIDIQAIGYAFLSVDETKVRAILKDEAGDKMQVDWPGLRCTREMEPVMLGT